MKSYAFSIQLRNENAEKQYREFHQNVWPEVAGPGGALEVIGILKMKIFLRPPLTLFMYIEAVDEFDPLRDFSRALDLDPRVREWDEIMHGEFLSRVEGNNGPLNWMPLSDVFSYFSNAEAQL